MRQHRVSTRFDGQRLRVLRQRRGMSVEDLAVASGITPRHIWRLEAGGRSDVRAETLARLALALDTSADYLLGLTDDPREPGSERGQQGVQRDTE